MVVFESMTDAEWLEWYLLTPQQRWEKSEKLWTIYLAMGGSLESEADPQSPFFDLQEYTEVAAEVQPDTVVIRRNAVNAKE